MPFTPAGLEALEAIHRDSAAFEAKYADVRYNDIPKAEIAAQRDRDVFLYGANRSAAYAKSPEHGELYDLMGQYLTLNTVEQARLNELYWKVFPLEPTREASAAHSPIAA